MSLTRWRERSKEDKGFDVSSKDLQYFKTRKEREVRL